MILQWNCDYLETKIDELESLVGREKVNVLMIQETKLGVADRTPNLLGFTAVRRDRKGSGAYRSRGGGLIMYIRNDLFFWPQNLGNLKGSVEAQAIRVPMTRTRSLVLVNLYVPPCRDGERRQLQEMEEVLRSLPHGPDVLWGGDLNAHHPECDQEVEEDARGGILSALMGDMSLRPLNS